MTVIAGLVHDGQVWMAADDAATASGTRWPNSRKVTRIPVGSAESALLATAGHAGLTTLARNGGLTLPPGPAADNEDDCNAWADAVSRALTDLAVEARPPLTDETGHIEGYGMLAHAGRLWCIAEHGAWPVTNYRAIGSGGDVALGALDVLAPMVRDGLMGPDAAVEAAAAAACRWDTGCFPPVHVHRL